MRASQEKVERFRALHMRDGAFVIPNPYDVGTAQILAGMGFEALATTSSGFAMTLGRGDYRVTRDEKLAHCRAICEAVDIPVTGDLEEMFADGVDGIGASVSLFAETGLVGGSIEDARKDGGDALFGFDDAVRRVEAAAAAAKAQPVPFVLTARAEGLLHGGTLDDVIARLKAFDEAGAEVLYAPGLRDIEQIKAVASAVTKPINVLNVFVQGASVADMAAAGAKRISVGGGLARAAMGGFIRAAEEMRDQGTHTFTRDMARGELGEYLTKGRPAE